MSTLKKLLPWFLSKDKDSQANVLVDAVSNSLDTSFTDIELLKLEMYLKSATGRWLDIWGKWFKTYRKSGESDTDYRDRIIITVMKSKNTIPAIVEGIRDYLKDDSLIIVYEPYKNLKTFNKSVFNGADAFRDGIYRRHAVIHIMLESSPSQELKDIVNELKAGGVRVVYSIVKFIQGENGCIDMSYTDLNLNLTKRIDKKLFLMSQSQKEHSFSGSISTKRFSGVIPIKASHLILKGLGTIYDRVYLNILSSGSIQHYSEVRIIDADTTFEDEFIISITKTVTKN